MLRTAAAVFVKSPGLSPVKTRLAARLGAEAATQFYLLSCAAVEEVLQETVYLDLAFWALAEAEAEELPWWKNLPRVGQGDGSLGERLHHVYSSLARSGQAVLLLGADAPQISPDLLNEAVRRLQSGDFVIGPALDGGFYLFGGSKPIPSHIWTEVRYSEADTCEQLCSRLKAYDDPGVSFLPPLRDVDEWEDLLSLKDGWRHNPPPLPAQRRLQEWCESVLR